VPEHTLYLGREWNVDHNKRAKVTNAELRYADLGKGEPVITVHGTSVADSLITPLKFYPKLFDEYRMISYYRAGYNGSKLLKDSCSIEEGAEHIKDLMDHLGIEKAHIVSFSFGGVIGFQFMLSYPERVHSSVLLEPYLPREEEAGVKANIDAYMAAVEYFQKGEKLKAGLVYMEKVCGPNFLQCVDLTGPLDVWKRVEESIETTFTVDFPAISQWPFRMSKADEMVAKKPTMPVLAMMGTDSESWCPGFRETQRFLMNWLPQAERAMIINATHGMQSMNPVAVGEALYTFLKRHPMSASEPSAPSAPSAKASRRG
jgi:pimeloyl-ACP methyl ester carboxylesterase